MFDEILVPLDGSDISVRVLAPLRRILRRQGGAKITLLRVLPTDDPHKHLRNRKEIAQRELDEALETLREQGAEVEGLLEVGDAAEVILRQAADGGFGLVAMATHGRSGISRWIRGSVAERVLRRCPKPLLLYNPTRLEEDAQGGFERILVPLDGSERGLVILEHVGALAKEFGSKVLLLKSGFTEAQEFASEEGGGLVVETPEQVRASLQPAEERLKEAGVTDVEVLVPFGDPAGQILEAAESQDVQLVAMTTHGRSGLDRWLFGATAEKVLRVCDRPLLVVRTPSGA